MTRDHVNLQRQPFLTPIWLAVSATAAALIVLALLVAAGWALATGRSTTVIVVRHAEQEASGADPGLTAAGQAHAESLARLFGDSRQPGSSLAAIYVSPALRNRLTAAPLAARLGLTPVVAPADDSRALARRVLREHSGERVLIVGHAGTVPDVVAALSGVRQIPAIGDDDYGTLYIVSIPRIGRADLLRLYY